MTGARQSRGIKARTLVAPPGPQTEQYSILLLPTEQLPEELTVTLKTRIVTRHGQGNVCRTLMTFEARHITGGWSSSGDRHTYF